MNLMRTVWVLAAVVTVGVSSLPPVLGALDPSGVLVLYNADSPDGAEITSYYSQVHPGVKTLGLSGLGLSEEISADEYLAAVRPQVLSALSPAIDVIVTTKGMPLRINMGSHADPGSYTDPQGVNRQVFNWSRYSSLESELTRIDTIGTWQQMGDQTWYWPDHPTDNPYFNRQSAFDRDAFDGMRLTARLDGFTAEDVKASIDRAQNAFRGGPNWFVVDDDTNAAGAGADKMEALVSNVLEPLQVQHTSNDTDTFVTSAPGPVVGYVSHGVHGGGKTAPDGYLIEQDHSAALQFKPADGAVFHTWESYNAYSFTEGGNRGGQALVAEWIQRGGTVGTGHVEEPGASPFNVTNEDAMFEMLLDGYTWAEAAWSATPQLSYVNTIVGDPLMVLRELLPGDANKDGFVGLADLSSLGANWGATGEPGDEMWSRGDFNGDGLVGLSDLSTLGARWGDFTQDYNGANVSLGEFDHDSALAAVTAPVPEPSTTVLAAAGLFVATLATRRRSRWAR